MGKKTAKIKTEEEILDDLCRERITEHCLELLIKYDIHITAELNKYMNKLIKKCHCDMDSSEFNTAMRIAHEVYLLHVRLSDRNKRKSDLDNMIIEKIDTKYIKQAQTHFFYKQHVETGKKTLQRTFNLINNDIQKMVKKDELANKAKLIKQREKELKIDLKSNNIKVNDAMKTTAYKRYIQYGKEDQAAIIIIINNQISKLKKNK